MKKISFFFSILLLLISIKTYAQPSDAAIPASSYQILIGHGFATDWFKGNNMDYNVQTLTDLKNQGFTNVRIRMDSSIYFSDAHFNLLSTIVDNCLAAGLVPIISWLNATVENRANAQDKIDYINWWTAVANKLKNKSHKVGFNLFTELGQSSPLRQTPSLYNSWTLDVYNAIRAISPTRMIILGSPGKKPDDLMLINYTNYNTSPYVMAEWHSYASGPNHLGQDKNWVGSGSASDKQNVIDLINFAKAFTTASGILTYVGAWMPMDNINGDLNQAEVESFATYFMQQLTQAGIPSSINKIDHFYDIPSNTWITNKTWGTTTLNMIPIKDIIKSFLVPNLPPSAPSSVVATAVNCTSANLTWADNSNNETGFNILKSSDGVNYTLAQTVGANINSYSFTNLTASTTYTFKVNAINAVGTSANATSNTITTVACPVNYTLSATATNGTVTPNSGSYLQGTNVTLTATPNAGYQFSSWSGDVVSTTNPLSVTMNSNKNIVANFTPISTTTTLTPIADTYVRIGAYKNTNFGSNNELQIKETTARDAKRITYLKFSLNGITNITNAILQVKNIGFNGTINVLQVANDNWAENTITWSNQPVLGTTIGSFAVTAIGTFSINVTNYVTAQALADGVVTLALTGVSGENLITLDSKEGAIAPKLIIKSSSTARIALKNTTDEKPEYSLKIYPNPTNENVTISIPNADVDNGKIMVFDYSGREISNTKITSSKMNINLKGTSGIYILKIFNNGQITVKQVIKK